MQGVPSINNPRMVPRTQFRLSHALEIYDPVRPRLTAGLFIVSYRVRVLGWLSALPHDL